MLNSKEKFTEKILLFGSYAKGTNFPDSDVDLFIVMNSSLRRDDRSREVSKLFPDRLFALDVVVFTPEEVAQSVQSKNSFITTILKEGKVLYEN